MPSLPSIPNPSRGIPSHRWPIALPPWADRHQEAPQIQKRSDLDYAKACQELRDLGFALAHSVRSISHSSLKFMREGEPPRPAEEHALWHHPAGVVARTRSYFQPAHEDFRTKREIPTRLVMDTLDVSVEVDSGAGPELSHIAAVEIRGSGSSTFMLDGTHRHMKDKGCALGDSLQGFLAICQARGRLVPVQEWTTQSRVFIPDEMILPITDPGPWRGKKVRKVLEENPEMRRQHMERFAASLPAPLDSLVRSSWETTAKKDPAGYAGDHPAPSNLNMEWTRVEYAHHEVAEALFLARKRFPSDSERAQVRHWMEVALGYHGEEPSRWRAFETGPAGLSLATVLLFSNSHAPAQARLLRLVQDAPSPVLARWLTQPDTAGYVLGQRLLARALSGSGTDKPDHTVRLLDEVLDAILARVSPQDIVLSTALRSPLGIWMQQRPIKHDSQGAEAFKEQAVAAHVMARLEGLGLDWMDRARGRNYPNTFTDKDRKLVFFDLPAPASSQEFQDMMGKRLSPGARPFLELLDRRFTARGLDACLPSAGPAPLRRRV